MSLASPNESDTWTDSSSTSGGNSGQVVSVRLQQVASAGDFGGTLELGTRLLGIAPIGLKKCYRTDGSFAHTAILASGRNGEVEKKGTNLRYAAISALGIARLSTEQQEHILAGKDARNLAQRIAEEAVAAPDDGACALALWAAAELGVPFPQSLLRRTIRLAYDPAPGVDTVIAAWILTALLAAGAQETSPRALHAAAARLMGGQRPSGLFPHRLAHGRPQLRSRIACFADQVYPIQALTRYYRAIGDEEALLMADACARRIVELQGPNGQWWWHYDSRTGLALEGYPVYSVHQHGMAPMALLELAEAGGLDTRAAVGRGLAWVIEHPETQANLISDAEGLVWRSVRRREPSRLTRYLKATAIQMGVRDSRGVLDSAFPPGAVDWECRPYELGWMLYAWLPEIRANSFERLREVSPAHSALKELDQ